MRQRVAAALVSRFCAGRSSNSGKPQSAAASCNLWLVFRSVLSIMPTTPCGAPDRSASSKAHKVSSRLAASTTIARRGSNPRLLRPCPDKCPHWRVPWRGSTKMIFFSLPPPGPRTRSPACVLVGGGHIKRASTATTNPNAAGSAACVAGTTSWSAPQGRPPFGKWLSSPASPKGRVPCKPCWKPCCKACCRHPRSRTSKRRNSAKVAARSSAGGEKTGRIGI